MAQERVNQLYGEQPFTIKKWNGSKKPVYISYGRYNPVNIMLDRGEYLYRQDMKNHVLRKIFDQVQAHLDQQGKNMTLIYIAGENDPALAVCHCCGEELRFNSGKKITPQNNGCIQHRIYLNNKEKYVMNNMAIEGIYATDSEIELADLLQRLEGEKEVLQIFIKQYERKVKSTKNDILKNMRIIEKHGIHKYYCDKFDEEHRNDENWCEEDEEILCA